MNFSDTFRGYDDCANLYGDSCKNVPVCMNGGSCWCDEGPEKAKCFCDNGYTGKICEIPPSM